LRQDMIEGFKRHDEILIKHEQELIRLREDMNKLREDMMRGFERVDMHLTAIGARWGIMSEDAFRAGLREIIEKEFGYSVVRWKEYDKEGYVHEYPSDVEIDVTVHDDKIILIEIKSYIRISDVILFKRKTEFYEKITGKKPYRKLVITPYAEEEALQTAKNFGIEIIIK
ncbi:MAG: DUF3782 domain-containing protein, partial [Thermoprotei archaeon]